MPDTPPLPYIASLATVDPEFAEAVDRIREMALYTPSALDQKTKMLIAFTLAVLRDHHDGVKGFAQRAREAGATDRELTDVVRVLYSMGGMQNLSVSVPGLGLK
jgi:alkylhydroperoxidase/carboxymuconolactone decarboxylase family protein YurZ